MVMVRLLLLVSLSLLLVQYARARQMYGGQLARATFAMPEKTSQWQSNLHSGYSGDSHGGQSVYSYGPGENHGASSGYGASFGDGKGVAHIRFVFGEPSAVAGGQSEYGQSQKYDSTRSAVSPFGHNPKYTSAVSEYDQQGGKYGGATSSATEYGQPSSKYGGATVSAREYGHAGGATSSATEYGQPNTKAFSAVSGYGQGGSGSSAEYGQQNAKYPVSGSLSGSSDYSGLSKFAQGQSHNYAQPGGKAASFAPEGQHIAAVAPYSHQGGGGGSSYENYSPSQLSFAPEVEQSGAARFGPSSSGHYSYAQPQQVSPQAHISHGNEGTHSGHHATTAELHPQESGQSSSSPGQGSWWEGWMKGWYDGYKYGGGKGHPLKQ